MKTGKYPPATGMVKNLRPLRENNAYLPALLRDSGYETGMAGKLHLFPADRDYGFEVRHLSDAPYSVYGNEDKYSEYIKWLRDNYFDAKGIDPVKIFDEDEASYDEDIKRFMMGSCFREEEEHETAWTTKRTLEFLENRDQKRPFFFYTSYFGPHQPTASQSPMRIIILRRTSRCRNHFTRNTEKNHRCFRRIAACCTIICGTA